MRKRADQKLIDELEAEGKAATFEMVRVAVDALESIPEQTIHLNARCTSPNCYKCQALDALEKISSIVNRVIGLKFEFSKSQDRISFPVDQIPKGRFRLRWWFRARLEQLRGWIREKRAITTYTVIMTKGNTVAYFGNGVDRYEAYETAMYWCGNYETSEEHCASLDWKEATGPDGAICFELGVNESCLFMDKIYR